jgi:hypothetical protein
MSGGGDMMITHVVLMKLKDQSTQSIQSSHDLLGSLNGKIPSLRYLEVGIDITRSERSYDLALITKFDDLAGLKAYLTHPTHLAVLTKLRELAASAPTVDYESR